MFNSSVDHMKLDELNNKFMERNKGGPELVPLNSPDPLGASFIPNISQTNNSHLSKFQCFVSCYIGIIVLHFQGSLLHVKAPPPRLSSHTYRHTFLLNLHSKITSTLYFS